MALTPQQEEYLNKYINKVSNPVQEDTNNLDSLTQLVKQRRTETKSFFQDTKEDITGVIPGIVERGKERVGNINEINQLQESGQQGGLRSFFQKTGQVAGMGADIIGEGVKGVVKSFLPQQAEDVVKTGVTKIAETEPVQAIVEKYRQIEQTNPSLAKDIDAVLGITDLVTSVVGTGLAGKGAKIAGEKALDAGIDVAKQTGKVIDKGIDVAKNVDTATGGLFTQTPKRVMTNLNAKKQFAQEVETLGTQVAKQTASPTTKKVVRNAVNNGIDIRDVGTLARVSKGKAKPLAKELFETAKRVAKGEDLDLAQIVGRPAIQSLNVAKTKLKTLGSELGDVANTLPKVTRQETTQAVFNKLKKVPGLSGLKLTKNGRLDFSDTVLTLAESASDRRAIESLFVQATRTGSGSAKHKLRQEMFEILGGKKKSLTNMTETQDKAIEAIRSGLSDILGSKNAKYKLLSNEYRKLVEPINALNRKLKATPDEELDILETTAGDLARRLTSNAPSRNEIEKLFRAIGASEEVKDMQDVLNVLTKYLDVSQKTSMLGISETALDKSLPTNILEIAGKVVQSNVGRTPAVQQEALEKLFKELF